jgi:invasion protein IalB
MRLMLAGLMLVIGFGLATAASAQTLRFQADDWVAECGSSQGADAECSIIGVFSSTNAVGPKGSFSLLIDLRNRMVAVVGKPFPSRASIRVDKNPPMECSGERYCIFSNADAEDIVRQLKSGSLILADVFAGKNQFRSSLSTRGFRADLDKIHAQGFRYFSD